MKHRDGSLEKSARLIVLIEFICDLPIPQQSVAQTSELIAI